MQLHVATDPDELSRQMAEWIISDTGTVLQQRDIYTLVLSGGSTPERLYRLLAEPHHASRINWQKIHIFFGDERYVPFADKRNNGKMAYDTLLSKVPVPESQIRYMDTTLPPEESAGAYAGILQQYFGKEAVTFDLVLLGMGDDGHTLSLFPGSALIHEEKKWVASPYVPAQEMYRITLTPAVVNRARAVAFMVTGEKKAATFKAVTEGPYQPEKLPSQIISPADGDLHWFVDAAASGRGDDGTMS
jgi:6-phosphogluconolactonase